MQIPGGIIAKKYGGKSVVGVAILVASVVTLMTPFVVQRASQFYVAYALRVAIGLLQGLVYPAILPLLDKWSPKKERSRMISIANTGMEVGTIAIMSLGGVLCNSTFIGGWPSVFVVVGLFGCVWFFAWCFCVSESPQQHPAISLDEKKHILGDTRESTEQPNVEPTNNAIPWIQILTSLPVWANVTGVVCYDWM